MSCIQGYNMSCRRTERVSTDMLYLLCVSCDIQTYCIAQCVSEDISHEETASVEMPECDTCFGEILTNQQSAEPVEWIDLWIRCTNRWCCSNTGSNSGEPARAGCALHRGVGRDTVRRKRFWRERAPSERNALEYEGNTL